MFARKIFLFPPMKTGEHSSPLRISNIDFCLREQIYLFEKSGAKTFNLMMYGANTAVDGLLGFNIVYPSIFSLCKHKLILPPSEREGDRRVHAVVEGACEREVLHFLWHLRTNFKINPLPRMARACRFSLPFHALFALPHAPIQKRKFKQQAFYSLHNSVKLVLCIYFTTSKKDKEIKNGSHQSSNKSSKRIQCRC